MSQKIIVIAAVSENGFIGSHGRIPWRLKSDMERFAALTTGHVVIMGRRTWESLSPRFRPLPDRVNIVITSREGFDAPGAIVVHTFEDAIAHARAQHPDQHIFIGGGEIVYFEGMKIANEFYLTEVQARVLGTSKFPDWNRSRWCLVTSEVVEQAWGDKKEEQIDQFPFVFRHYVRRA